MDSSLSLSDLLAGSIEQITLNDSSIHNPMVKVNGRNKQISSEDVPRNSMLNSFKLAKGRVYSIPTHLLPGYIEINPIHVNLN